MKLLKLIVDNFRVFNGKHVLNLDVSEGKPAVLVFGMNGTGKTTLLNAFTWALYGTFTEDMERQDRIINDQTWAQTAFGALVSASVTLEFEHENVRFTVQREVAVTKSTEEQYLPDSRLVLTQSRHGESSKVENGQDRIEKILPEGLRRFFFFNGERMERMFTNDGSNEVKQAIKTMLGLEAFERAIEIHLPAAAKVLNREAGKVGDGRLQQLSEEMERLGEKWQAIDAKMLKCSADESSFKREVEEADRALADHREAEPLQKSRLKLQRELAREHERRQDLQDRKKRILSDRGFIAFSAGLDSIVMKLAEGMRQRRELPAGIQRDYIDSLLEDGSCMCGTTLPEGSSARQALEERRFNAGLEDVQTRWMNLRGQTARLADDREELLKELKSVTQDIQEAEQSINRIDAELSDISRQLEGMNVADIQRLEQRRNDFDAKRLDAHAQWRRAQDEWASIEAQIEKQKRLIGSAKAQNEEGRRIQRRIALVEEVLVAFRRILDLRTEEARVELDAKVKAVFSRICIKPFTPDLNDQFELELKAKTDGLAAIRSTGENQILGLSFVGAVSEMAREIHEKKAKSDPAEEILAEGGIYPVVMDAPFGNLDIEYQDQVAESLPRLTSQIVTLLSQSQSRDKVMDHLQAAASRMYVLRSVTSKPDAKEQFIMISGRAVPYVTRGEFEHTILQEVTV